MVQTKELAAAKNLVEEEGQAVALGPGFVSRLDQGLEEVAGLVDAIRESSFEPIFKSLQEGICLHLDLETEALFKGNKRNSSEVTLKFLTLLS